MAWGEPTEIPTAQVPEHVRRLRGENAVMREGLEEFSRLTLLAPGTSGQQVAGKVRDWAERILRDAEGAGE